MSHGTCSYIRMYINAVADSVMLYSRNDFYNVMFKIEHKLHIASGSALPPPKEKFWLYPWYQLPCISPIKWRDQALQVTTALRLRLLFFHVTVASDGSLTHCQLVATLWLVAHKLTRLQTRNTAIFSFSFGDHELTNCSSPREQFHVANGGCKSALCQA